MSSTPLVEKTLTLLAQARARLQAFPQTLTPSERDRIGSLADWSARDILPHVAHWNNHVLTRMDCFRLGVAPEKGEDYNLVNDRVQQACCQKSWETLLAEADETYASLIEQVQAFEPGALEDPARHEWQRNNTLVVSIISTAVFHLEWHLAEYERKHGDPARGAAAFADFTRQTADIPGWEANAWYNLACVDSMAGLKAPALEALAKALPLSPRLKEWAPQDDDLAALRGDPAFAALMAG